MAGYPKQTISSDENPSQMARKISSDGANSKPPTVILVTGSLQSGGAERVMSDMANYWSDKGWHITLATWTGPLIEDFYKLHPHVYRTWLDVYSPNNSAFQKWRSHTMRILKLRRLLTTLKPDAIVSFIDTSNVLTIIAAIGLKARVVVSERIHPGHHLSVSWPARVLRKALYARANAVIAQTQSAADWIEKECRTKAHVIPNPLRRLPDISIQREYLILSVGRLAEQKGFDLLLYAFAKIHRAFGDWRVVIVGSGPEQTALLKLRDELNLVDCVEFVQPVHNVESWMSRAGLFVQPSRFEGFPNALLEAMGMGAAVISANCPSGPSEIVQDGINGRLVPVEDVNALAQAMADLMCQPEVRSQFGKNATKVRELYRQEKIMVQWEQRILCRT